MRKFQIFWIIILLGVGGFFLFKFLNPPKVIHVVDSSLHVTEEEGVLVGEGQDVSNVSATKKEFAHAILGFSFSYPKDYSIVSFGNFYDPSGQTILLKDASEQSVFQVFITPFDEDIALTAERIKKDIPSLSMSEVSMITMGSVKAVKFGSSNALSTGPSMECWFVHNGNLYQISSPAASKDAFNDIIGSWKVE